MPDFQLNIDCEGPLTQNDNAFELCEAFIPSGEDFFSKVSRYDDYLVEVEHRPDYKAGDTLKLILPFLKAFGLDSDSLQVFSAKTLMLLPGADSFLRSLPDMLPSFIISTSYEPYLKALCDITDFPSDCIYATNVDLDRYTLDDDDRIRLQIFLDHILGSKMIDWPDDARSVSDLSPDSRESVDLMNRIFWQYIPSMSIGSILDNVNPIGGTEKARAVEHSLKRTGLSLSQVVYVGDSITDANALELVVKSGGIGIAFNANRYAIKKANWALTGGDSRLIGAILSLILDKGPDALHNITSSQNWLAGKEFLDILRGQGVSSSFIDPLMSLSGLEIPTFSPVSLKNIDQLIEHGERVRKVVRGVATGALG